MSTWKEYIEELNSGDTDFLENFGGDVGLFVDLIIQKGLLKHLRVNQSMDAEVENKIVLAFYEHHMPSYLEFLQENLSDVELENRMFYFVGDSEDLSILFDEGRNTLQKKTIEKILSGEGLDFEFFDYTTTDVYSEVVEELNTVNLNSLYEAVLHFSKDVEIEPSTELLELIAEEQGHPNFVIIDKNNVERIVEDKETFDSILNDELSELKGNLRSLHHSAYNSAYEDEVYESVWKELDKFFVTDQRKWVSVPMYTGPAGSQKIARTIERIKLPIKDLPEIINDFLRWNIESTYPESVMYYGNYASILKFVVDESSDYLKVYPPDYPDSYKVDRNINEMFNDYIY
jgi:hypothetical protein